MKDPSFLLIEGYDIGDVFLEANKYPTRGLCLITDVLLGLIVSEIKDEQNLLDVSDVQRVEDGWLLVFDGKIIHLKSEPTDVSCDDRYPIPVIDKILIGAKQACKAEKFRVKILEFAKGFPFGDLVEMASKKLNENEKAILYEDVHALLK
ncbi:MAG: hypothetical protein PHW24_04135 [Candidatus Moranbacteria bacterium]|jgi:hypothetical protein|nr:hypothetical protein [Candidatus Moranbacteria bacterium]